MRMTEKDIREQFRITDRMITVDEKRKEETWSLLRKEIYKKKTGIVHSRKKMLIQQLRYMNKSMLGVHMAFCILSVLFMSILRGYNLMSGMEEKDILWLSIIVSGILGVVSNLGVGHVFYSGIAELSESCYFNVRQMVAFQLFLSGVISLAVLTVDILFIGTWCKIHLLRVGLYVFVPYLLTECCCLTAVLTETGRKNSYLLAAAGVFGILCSGLLFIIPDLYEMTALTVWGVAFIIGLVLSVIQIRMLFRGIEKGEILCTN